MATSGQIRKFLQSPAFAVVGASKDRSKYGNKVLRKYLEHRLKAYPVNPKEKEIEGLTAFTDVLQLPEDVQSLSIVTPPEITEVVVDQAIKKGIRNLWMQPGAQSPAAVQRAEREGLNVIADGSCLLVTLG